MKLLKTVFAGLLSLVLLTGPVHPAGTLFGLPLSQQVDNNGKPIVGGLLTIYEADTTTPVTVYEDSSLDVEIPNPLETDANGRLPEFWLDDGSYRARFTTSGGVVIFDNTNITALGASAGEGGGGSGVSQQSIFTTGMFTWLPLDSTKTGWVRANARTIGSAASGATERANADTQPLYEWLWANCSDANCPVTGGRGASASADFAANKPIATLDMRGRSPIGLDTMGNSAADIVAAATTAGNSGGAEDISITIAKANLPSYNLSNNLSTATHGHSLTMNAHDHSLSMNAHGHSLSMNSHTHGNTFSIGTANPTGNLVTNVSTSNRQSGSEGTVSNINQGSVSHDHSLTVA